MGAFNGLGLVLFAGIGWPLHVFLRDIGFHHKGAFMVCLGVLVGTSDLLLRRLYFRVEMWNREHGARFLGLPIWTLATVWIVLGITYLLR